MAEKQPSLRRRGHLGPQEKDDGCFSFTTTLESLAICLLGMAVTVVIFTRCAITNIETPQAVLVTALSSQNCTRMLDKLREHLCEKLESPTTEQPICKLCPNAWLLSRENCYFFSEEQKTWNASRDNCQSQGSRLLTVQHDSEMDLVEKVGEDVDFFWTGYQYNATEKRWIWPNEFPDQEFNMKMQSSYVANNRHSCGAYRKREIHHASCISLNRWICKKKAFQLDL